MTAVTGRRPEKLSQNLHQKSSPPQAPQSSRPPAAPRKGPEHIDLELLQGQKKQSAALQTDAREMRVVSSLARAARCNTQAVAMHCRQMVSAVSALTMAVSSVARGLQDGMQAVAALSPGGEAAARQPGTGEEDRCAQRASSTCVTGNTHNTFSCHVPVLTLAVNISVV